MENQATRRRWFRFSLRTLLVLVTLVCVYLGWTMNWIRQRHEYLQETNSNPYLSLEGIQFDDQLALWSLRIFNEAGTPRLYIQKADEQKPIEVSRLFPEARVWFVEMEKNGIRFHAVMNEVFTPFDSLPYFQNGILFGADRLKIVSEPSNKEQFP